MSVLNEGDRELVLRFKDGDISSFDEIYDKYNKAVYFYLLKMTHEESAAEDVLQDAFIKVYKGLREVDQSVHLQAWIYKIAHNACMDYFRRNKRKTELLEALLLEGDSRDMPEDRLLNIELGDKIKKVMSKLNPRHKSVLILKDYNDLSYAEIARIMNITDSAVKSLIYRARQEFQKLYREVD